MSITYISLEDFTLHFPTSQPGELLEIFLKSGQIFDFVNVDWMNWIQIKIERPPNYHKLDAEVKVIVIETGSTRSHIFRLDNDKRCIRLDQYQSFLRDKQISKIID